MQAQKTFCACYNKLKQHTFSKNDCNTTLVDNDFHIETFMDLCVYTSNESFSHLLLTFFHYIQRGPHERCTMLRTRVSFVCRCPHAPINVNLYENMSTWNATHFLINFHDDLHPPDPNQCQFSRNFSFPEGGRAMRASAFVLMTLTGAWGNAWK